MYDMNVLHTHLFVSTEELEDMHDITKIVKVRVCVLPVWRCVQGEYGREVDVA